MCAIALWSGWCCAQEPLNADAAIERTLAKGQRHEFALPLSAGDYVAFEVTERGVDVLLSVRSPSGERVEDWTPQSRQDASYPRLLATSAGVHQVVIAGRSGDGVYELKITALRPANERDVSDVRGHEAWRRAVQSASAETPEGLRSALRDYALAAQHYEASGDVGQQARALLRVGRMHYLLHERQAAVASYERALPLYRAVNDRRGEAALLNNLGSVHQAMAEPTLALRYFEHAAAVFREAGDAYRTATALHNIGWVHHSLGEFKRASELYREALSLWPSAGNKPGEAQTTHSLGMLYFDLGQPDRSAEYFEASLELRRALGDRSGEAQTLGNLGAMYVALGEPSKARAAFAQGLAAAREAEDKVEEAAALLGLASVDERGGGDAALKIIEALGVARSVNDRRREALALLRLGEWRRMRGELVLAADQYAASLALHRAAGDARGEAETLLALARLKRDAGRLQEARADVEAAIAHVESLRGRLVQPDLRASYFASVQSYYDLYIDVLMRLHESEPSRGHDIAAWRASERARARSLLERLSEQQSELLTDADARLLERERERRRDLNAKDQQWRSLTASGAGVEELREARRALDEALRALRDAEGELRARSPRYAELTQLKPIGMEALQAHLGADAVLLEYWLGADRSYLWVIAEGLMSAYALEAASKIEAQVRDYFASVSARPSFAEAGRGASRAGIELARSLLPMGAAASLERKRAVVVSHGALEYLPFAVLPDVRARNAPPLLRAREIVSLPSASVLPVLQQYASRERPPKTIAVFGDPVFSRDDPRFASAGGASTLLAAAGDEDLQRSVAESGVGKLRRLRFSRIEANAISELAPASERFAALDFDASRKTALSPQMQDYRILHFATHGLVNSVHPELSGLVFSAFDEAGRPQDSLLRLHDIYGMSLRADLVVLSACQTALGPAVKGEGLVSLTRGFMYAGAPRVLATLWSVDDNATAHMMKRFYEELLVNELQPAAALRKAQLAMLEDPRWSAPYYWGGFVLQGDWR